MEEGLNRTLTTLHNLSFAPPLLQTHSRTKRHSSLLHHRHTLREPLPIQPLRLHRHPTYLLLLLLSGRRRSEHLLPSPAGMSLKLAPPLLVLLLSRSRTAPKSTREKLLLLRRVGGRLLLLLVLLERRCPRWGSRRRALVVRVGGGEGAVKWGEVEGLLLLLGGRGLLEEVLSGGIVGKLGSRGGGGVLSESVLFATRERVSYHFRCGGTRQAYL